MAGQDKLLALVAKPYEWLVLGGNFLQPVFLLVFRLTWGWQFFVTGKGKLLHHSDVAQFFASLHIPLPDLNAWFVAGLECVGGLLLIAGLGSRLIGLLLSGNMVVAYLAVEEDRAKVFNVFNDLDAFTHADPFFFLLTAVIVLVFGPGVLSADYLLYRFFFKTKLGKADA
ncbi:MAG TPA: DoxX family protein [Candidatus Obscuribacterales bacterium]